MEGLLEDLIDDDLVYIKYACITSADAERSFSRYKNILSDNCRRLDIDNLKKLWWSSTTNLIYLLRCIYFFGSKII